MSNVTELSIVPSGESSTRASLAPTNMAEALEFSRMLSTSSFIPKDFHGKPGDILVAIQWGMEIGLAPLQALQNIAVINGRPTIWGDAALGIVQAHPEYVRHEEGVKGEGDNMTGWHTITRKGHQPHTVEFSVACTERQRKRILWAREIKPVDDLSEADAAAACARVCDPRQVRRCAQGHHHPRRGYGYADRREVARRH